jgi:hypothetical protein
MKRGGMVKRGARGRDVEIEEQERLRVPACLLPL